MRQSIVNYCIAVWGSSTKNDSLIGVDANSCPRNHDHMPSRYSTTDLNTKCTNYKTAL